MLTGGLSLWLALQNSTAAMRLFIPLNEMRGGACVPIYRNECYAIVYLVDPASSHMLVLKAKPCMC